MSDEDRDLGALFARITQLLIAAELPLLAAHGIEMWPYVVLRVLQLGPASTQLELAMEIGYDKTRLIKILDELSEAGLIERRADPADRRARIVTLTDAGRAKVTAVRADIRAMEAEFLAGLGAAEQQALRELLTDLAGWG